MGITAFEELMGTPSDLQESSRKKIGDALNPLVADYFALYIKTKNYHWHMSGRNFRDYHEMLDDHSDQIIAVIDPLAERVRKLGVTTIRSVAHVSQLQKVKDNDEDFVAPIDMLKDLVEENKALVSRLRAAHEICDQGGDIASASLLEQYVDEAEKRIWFLYEASRDLV